MKPVLFIRISYLIIMIMKTFFISLILAIAISPKSAWAQKTYSTLWKQVTEAGNKDLPKTQLQLLSQIMDKARQEQAYGQMMKAEVMAMKCHYEISADSLKPAVDRLEAKMAATDDEVARAVMAAVLAKTYSSYGNTLSKEWQQTARLFAKEAMKSPEILAKTKADDYKPLVVEGYNASVFAEDLLSVVGYETGEFAAMSRYYEMAGNRRAACITALMALKADRSRTDKYGVYTINKSPYIYSLDSLVNVYKDIDVAGEAAVERYYAMDFCKDCKPEKKIKYIHFILENWPGWQRAGEMRNEEKQLTRPSLCAKMTQTTVRPGVPVKITLENVRNLKNVTASIYTTNLAGNDDVHVYDAKTFKKFKQNIKNPQMPLTETRQLPYRPNYEQYDDTLTIQGLPCGVYLVELISQPTTETAYLAIHVSDVTLLKQALPGNKVRYAVVNSTTGMPLANASIELKEGKDVKTLRCNKNGEVVYKYEKRVPTIEYAYTNDDKAAPRWTLPSYFYNEKDNGKGTTIKVFTDRAIYRPGQTVHMSAVCFRKDDWITSVADENRKVTARLLDANRKTVAEKSLEADKYGTVTTDFILPEGVMSGAFTVKVEEASTIIKVEEYKRPSFKVEIPKVNSPYHNGDTLYVEGRAMSYAGVPVQGARVVYRVERKAALWWRASDHGASEELLTEETITDGEGRFEVELPLVLPEEALATRRFYNFQVTADVTDISGETRVGTMTLPLGSRTTAISCNLGDKVLADSLKSVIVYLKNSAGIDVSTDVRMRVDNGVWLNGRTMLPIALPERLASGEHTLFAICDSDTLEQKFVAFGLDDKVPCVKTDDWFYCSSEKFTEGGDVVLQAGASGNTHIFYTVFAEDNVVEQGYVDKKNELINRRLKYKKEFGKGITVTLAWVKDGKCYKHTARISRPTPDKRLKLKWTTFRDRLLPGQKEQWKLTVTRPDGKPADARLMATMYDKSLDDLHQHQWTLNVSQWLPLPQSTWNSSLANRYMTRFMQQKFNSFTFHNFGFSSFDESLFERLMRPMVRGLSKEKLYMSSAKAMNGVAAKVMDTMAVEEMVAATEMDNNKAEKKETGYDNSTPQEENIRENMNETAFFMPMLTTDENGSVSLSFTLPETLTSWRMMGLANTTDMMTGYIEGETVAQKEVMVQPNLPRFLRTGDLTQFTAKIFNTGNQDIQGTVRMDIIDPETEKTLATLSKPFSVAVNKTTVAAFDYKADGSHTLLVVKIVANGNTFSDGEQHYIAVLPDKERVTVTKTFTQNKPGSVSVDLTKMFAVKDETSRLTIEHTNNPAWLMVQALPTMAQPHTNNAVDLATSLYANTIARHIAQKNPEAVKTFRLWKEERAGEGTLAANLEKNMKLKDVLTSETPWVGDAETETEQKHALAMLFDNNAMEARLNAAADKLRKLQNTDGSWSWWQGMKGNAWMTQGITTILARMKTATGDNTHDTMLNNALNYLDTEMTTMVENMKREEKKGNQQTFPGSSALEYLYTNAILDRTPKAQAKAASDYLTALLKKESKTMSMFAKALAAIVLQHNGDTKTAKTYVKSIEEHTVATAADGRYFDSYRAVTTWRDYTIPTQTAAIETIIRCGDKGVKEKSIIDEMRRWLLQQKRTQAWDTPVNSVDAINAFLLDNKTALSASGQTDVSIDNRKVELPKATAGMGYQKAVMAYEGEKKLTFTTSSDHTSWGNVYAQFMQKTDKIAASGEGLKVKREMVMPKEGLKVGDRVKVRITVIAERNMDFVEIVDRRASCMEPITQLSGYRNGYYCMPKDNATYYFFDRMAKGEHVIETEYFIDRNGTYCSGSCTAQCAYAPEFKASNGGTTLIVK